MKSILTICGLFGDYNKEKEVAKRQRQLAKKSPKELKSWYAKIGKSTTKNNKIEWFYRKKHPDKYKEICDNISRGRGGQKLKAEAFLTGRKESFTQQMFWKVTGYKTYNVSSKALAGWLAQGKIKVVGKQGQTILYESLI